MMASLTTRGSQSGHLSWLEDGTYFSRACLVKELKRALVDGEIDADKYNGHSYRIGAASTDAEKGNKTSVFKHSEDERAQYTSYTWSYLGTTWHNALVS